MDNYFESYNLPISEKFKQSTKTLSIMTPSVMVFFAMLDRQEIKNENVTLRLNTEIIGRPVLEYNPEFVNAIHPDTLAILCYIESMRLVLHHCTKRALPPPEINYLASNLVLTSKHINRLVAGNPTLIDVCKLFPKVSDFVGVIPGSFDPNTDLFHERIFRWLSANMPRIDSAMNPFGNENKPNTVRRGLSQSEKGLANSEQDAMRKHFSKNQMGQNSSKWKPNEAIDLQVSNEVNKMPLSSWGDLPGSVLKELVATNEQMVDPRAALSRFARTVISTQFAFSRSKLCKRLDDSYIGIIPGKRFTMQSKILIAIDTSGSMSDKDVINACSCVKDFVKSAEVDYTFWDTKCYEIKQMKHKPKHDTKFKIEGRGGTDPQCVFKKLESENLKYDGIVFITDCEFALPKPTNFNPNRIFFISTTKNPSLPHWVNRNWTMEMESVYKYTKER